jgi:hypothetical protein
LENAGLYSDLQRSEASLAQGQRISHTGSFGWSVLSGEIFWSDETFRIFECDPATKPTVDSESEMIETEYILEATEKRVVIVRMVIAASLHIRRNYQRSCPAAAGPVRPGATVLGPVGSLQQEFESVSSGTTLPPFISISASSNVMIYIPSC